MRETHVNAKSLTSITTGRFVDSVSVVGDQHFGGIYTTFFELKSFAKQAEAIDVHHIRWPGGTRGETQRDTNDADGDGDTEEFLYSLTQEDILTVPGKGLTDVLNYANSASMAFTMFVPVDRYANNLDAAEQDVRQFVTKLLKGSDGGFGELPDSFTIEIGNESVGMGVVDAAQYGQIANRQLTAIREVLADSELNPSGLDLKVGVQLGQDFEEDAAIRSAIAVENLAIVDVVVNHHLPLNIVTLNKPIDATHPHDEGANTFDRFKDYVAAWERDVANAQGSDRIDLNYYVSAWTVGSAGETEDWQLEYQDYGARQARTAVDTFSRMVASGVDSAALWGIDARSNSNWFSTLANGEVQLSHGGEVFQLMSESLIGTKLNTGYAQSVPNSVHGSFSNYWIYSYENADKIVLFLTANDLIEPVDVTIKLQSIGGIDSIEATRVGTHVDTAFAGDPNSAEARLHERPTVESVSAQFDDSHINFTLTQDYEVVRFIIDKSAPPVQYEALNITGSSREDKLIGDSGNDSIFGGNGSDKIWGLQGNDLIQGGRGKDTLFGGHGDDRILGGAKNDRLFGGSGDDWLNGGAGRDKIMGANGFDVMIGGPGRDQFIFRVGDDHDTIKDFRSGHDKLVFRGIRKVDVEIEHAGHDTVIHYGDHDSITLVGLQDYDLSDLSIHFI